MFSQEPEDYNFVNESNTNKVHESFHFHHEIDIITPLPQDHNSDSHYSSTMSNSSGDANSFERPSKTLKTNPSNTGYPSSQKKDSSFPYILSFNNENPEPEPILNIDSSSTLKPKAKSLNHGKSLTSNKGSLENQKKETKRKKNDSFTRSSQHNQDHVLAERKRREKLSQQFIALSALIPGLKKMDKASVLSDAVNHVKQLQEQVKVLEEKNTRFKNVESVVYVEKNKNKKSYSHEDVSDTSSNSGYGNCYHESETMPEVEARVSEKNVLIRIHCEKKKEVLVKIMKEIENLHLSVTSSSTLQFGNTNLDITVIAQMDEEFSLSVQELARNLRVGLLKFMEL